MKNKIILILIAGILVIIFSSLVKIIPTTENNTEKISIDPNIPGQTLPLSNAPKDVAWALFSKYNSLSLRIAARTAGMPLPGSPVSVQQPAAAV